MKSAAPSRVLSDERGNGAERPCAGMSLEAMDKSIGPELKRKRHPRARQHCLGMLEDVGSRRAALASARPSGRSHGSLAVVGLSANCKERGCPEDACATATRALVCFHRKRCASGHDLKTDLRVQLGHDPPASAGAGRDACPCGFSPTCALSFAPFQWIHCCSEIWRRTRRGARADARHRHSPPVERAVLCKPHARGANAGRQR